METNAKSERGKRCAAKESFWLYRSYSRLVRVGGKDIIGGENICLAKGCCCS